MVDKIDDHIPPPLPLPPGNMVRRSKGGTDGHKASKTDPGRQRHVWTHREREGEDLDLVFSSS